MFFLEWQAVHYAFFLPLFLMVVAFLSLRIVRLQKRDALLAGTRPELFTHPFSLARHVASAVLFSIGFLCLLLALMRPCFPQKVATASQQSVHDLFIVLDVSRSMLAMDCGTDNRLVQAKKKIKVLVDLLGAARVGLVLFSGSAFVQCPLTTDYQAFHLFLEAVDAESLSSGTTALDQALKKVLMAFQAAPERKSKVVVIFTDGEDFSTDLESFKKQARDEKLSVFACGVGSPNGAPIPLFDQAGKQIGHQKDRGGAIVISKLNEPMLRSLAHQLGGFYCPLTADNRDMKSLAVAVSRFEKEVINQSSMHRCQDLYHYFLLVSVACFALEWLC